MQENLNKEMSPVNLIASLPAIQKPSSAQPFLKGF
jgi:hypothetical protein